MNPSLRLYLSPLSAAISSSESFVGERLGFLQRLLSQTNRNLLPCSSTGFESSRMIPVVRFVYILITTL